MADTKHSMPRIPPFGTKEPGFLFALWLRDRLYKNDELKRKCAHLLDVSVETITHYTRESGARPTFDSAVTLLYALHGIEEFFGRLEGPEGSMVSTLNGTLGAFDAAMRRLAHHPPRSEAVQALDLVHEVQLRAAQLAQSLSKEIAENGGKQ